MSTPDHDVSPIKTGRRERKKLETRERIFESGVTLFATHGYDSTTMEQIGEGADVSRATVFNYFARKEDIVFEWFGRLRTEFASALAEDEQHTLDSTSRLRRTFRVLADLYEDDPATGRAMVRAWQRARRPPARRSIGRTPTRGRQRARWTTRRRHSPRRRSRSCRTHPLRRVPRSPLPLGSRRDRSARPR